MTDEAAGSGEGAGQHRVHKSAARRLVEEDLGGLLAAIAFRDRARQGLVVHDYAVEPRPRSQVPSRPRRMKSEALKPSDSPGFVMRLQT